MTFSYNYSVHRIADEGVSYMTKGVSGKVRIIGGKWRSRKITFSAIPGLRPTHDRIRETLFNWLNTDVEGAICLDLFAGSGALGFEALSRGAKQVTFVDNSPLVVSSLKKNAAILGDTSSIEIICANFPDPMLSFKHSPFDIVFVDPPFFQDLIPASIECLIKGNHMKKGALVYREAEANVETLPVPSGFEQFREKRTGAVIYGLMKLILQSK